MRPVLCVPLNTNHVLIFERIIRSLRCEYEVLCHDRISEAEQYHTAGILERNNIPFRHFSTRLQRSSSDSSPARFIDFFRLKKLVRQQIRETKPGIIVFAVDNDPIARLFIGEARRQGIQTVLVQEALIRPHEFVARKTYLSAYLYRLLSVFGVHLAYSKYGASGCDYILVSGRRAKEIMARSGVPENRIAIVGMPKYDALLERVSSCMPRISKEKVYLFAASTTVVKDEKNIRFVKMLIESAESLGIHLIIKLHPRTPQEPSDIYRAANALESPFLSVVKEGDDTFDILSSSDGLVTVSSTVVLEALMMNKECVIADYLAGESRLDYAMYDAVHCIRAEGEILDTLRQSLIIKKDRENKKRLLEDELYKTDGNAGMRAAQLLEGLL